MSYISVGDAARVSHWDEAGGGGQEEHGADVCRHRGRRAGGSNPHPLRRLGGRLRLLVRVVGSFVALSQEE